MQRTDFRRRARPALALAAVLLSSCQQMPIERTPPKRAKPTPIHHLSQNVQREATMTEQWQNHRYSELVAALGTPTMVMNIPGGGSPPGFAVVFGRDPRTGCIDAFALMYGGGQDPVVRAYHCR
jgi:hypothetical protein